MNRQTDWCESHGCLRISCIQRGLHRVGEPEGEDPPDDANGCEVCEFAVDAMGIEELRTKLRSYMRDHAKFLRAVDDASIKLSFQKAHTRHWARECDQLRTSNRKLVDLLRRAREAINEEAWTVLDEELRAAIDENGESTNDDGPDQP